MFLSDDEYNSLIGSEGEEITKKAIEKIAIYKSQNPSKQGLNDYATILDWGITKAKRDIQEQKEINQREEQTKIRRENFKNKKPKEKQINKSQKQPSYNSNLSDEELEEYSKDFEKCWKLYPKKEGGKNIAFENYCEWRKGKNYCGKIKTLTQDDIYMAINTYIYLTKEDNVEYKYLKSAKNFFENFVYDYYKGFKSMTDEYQQSFREFCKEEYENGGTNKAS